MEQKEEKLTHLNLDILWLIDTRKRKREKREILPCSSSSLTRACLVPCLEIFHSPASLPSKSKRFDGVFFSGFLFFLFWCYGFLSPSFLAYHLGFACALCRISYVIPGYVFGVLGWWERERWEWERERKMEFPFEGYLVDVILPCLLWISFTTFSMY